MGGALEPTPYLISIDLGDGLSWDKSIVSTLLLNAFLSFHLSEENINIIVFGEDIKAVIVIDSYVELIVEVVEHLVATEIDASHKGVDCTLSVVMGGALEPTPYLISIDLGDGLSW